MGFLHEKKGFTRLDSRIPQPGSRGDDLPAAPVLRLLAIVSRQNCKADEAIWCDQQADDIELGTIGVTGQYTQ